MIEQKNKTEIISSNDNVLIPKDLYDTLCYLGIIIDEMIIYCVQLILPKNYYHNRDCEK